MCLKCLVERCLLVNLIFVDVCIVCFSSSVFNVASIGLKSVEGSFPAVPVCHVMHCTRTIGRRILFSVPVWCAARLFQQRTHCRLPRLVCPSRRGAPIRFILWLVCLSYRLAPIRLGSCLLAIPVAGHRYALVCTIMGFVELT